MAAEERVLDLGDDGLVVAEDAGEHVGRRRAERGDEVGADLVLDRARAVAAGLEFAEGVDRRGGRRGVGHGGACRSASFTPAAARRSRVRRMPGCGPRPMAPRAIASVSTLVLVARSPPSRLRGRAPPLRLVPRRPRPGARVQRCGPAGRRPGPAPSRPRRRRVHRHGRRRRRRRVRAGLARRRRRAPSSRRRAGPDRPPLAQSAGGARWPTDRAARHGPAPRAPRRPPLVPPRRRALGARRPDPHHGRLRHRLRPGTVWPRPLFALHDRERKRGRDGGPDGRRRARLGPDDRGQPQGPHPRRPAPRALRRDPHPDALDGHRRRGSPGPARDPIRRAADPPGAGVPPGRARPGPRRDPVRERPQPRLQLGLRLRLRPDRRHRGRPYRLRGDRDPRDGPLARVHVGDRDWRPAQQPFYDLGPVPRPPRGRRAGRVADRRDRVGNGPARGHARAAARRGRPGRRRDHLLSRHPGLLRRARRVRDLDGHGRPRGRRRAAGLPLARRLPAAPDAPRQWGPLHRHHGPQLRARRAAALQRARPPRPRGLGLRHRLQPRSRLVARALGRRRGRRPRRLRARRDLARRRRPGRDARGPDPDHEPGRGHGARLRRRGRGRRAVPGRERRHADARRRRGDGRAGRVPDDPGHDRRARARVRLRAPPHPDERRRPAGRRGPVHV